MGQFICVGRESDVPVGSAKEVEFQGRIVALFNVAGTIYALDGICPHLGGPLGEGELHDTVVACPWHGWQFDVTNGRNVFDPTLALCSDAVNLEGGNILLSVP